MSQSHDTKALIGNPIKSLFNPDDIISMRFWYSDGTVFSGAYSDHNRLYNHLLELDTDADIVGIYYALNPCSQTFFDGYSNQNRFDRGRAAGKGDIQCYAKLVIDVDTIKHHGDVATAEEKAASREVAERVRAFLAERGIASAFATSGNGWYPIVKLPNLPVNAESQTLIKRILFYLAFEFDVEGVAKIDNLNNADRLTRALGTMNRKGVSASTPYWRSELLSVPTPSWEPATLEALQAIAALAPSTVVAVETPTEAQGTGAGAYSPSMVEGALEAYTAAGMIDGYRKVSTGKWALDSCPWEEEHTTTASATTINVMCIRGVPGFNDARESCQNAETLDGTVGKRTWADFRAKCDPDHTLYRFPWELSDAETLAEGFAVDNVENEPEPEPEADKPHRTSTIRKERHTDTGNGERLVRLHGEDMRYVRETGEWVVWGERGWETDKGDKVQAFTKSVIAEVNDESRMYADEKTGSLPREVNSWLVRTGSASGRKAMLTTASTEQGIFTRASDWDADAWTLNVANGVLDLRTQTFRARTKADLLSRKSPVVYDPNATCPTFLSALNDWSCGDADWIKYVQVALAYSLTSDTRLQCFFMAYGEGSNGKDTLIKIIEHIMGAYCTYADIETFCESRYHSEHRNDLAALAGANRLVYSSEPSGSHVWDEGKLKQLTGTSAVKCRNLYQAQMQYKPEFKLWFLVNKKPIVKSDDLSVWRRVKAIPFNFTVAADKRDGTLDDKLKAEAAGVLNWLLEGVRMFVELGYKLPACKAVEDATDEYRKEMDLLGQFAADTALVFKPSASMCADTLYAAYKKWCEDTGNHAWKRRQFYTEFTKKFKLESTRTNSGKFVHGVACVASKWLVEDMDDVSSTSMGTGTGTPTSTSTSTSTSTPPSGIVDVFNAPRRRYPVN